MATKKTVGKKTTKKKAPAKKAQPKSRGRKKPGTGGSGKFYRIEVRESKDFVDFRNQDVGKKGGLERVAGKRANGRWATVAWLISKENATVKNGKLSITNKKEREALTKQLGAHITHVKGDVFTSTSRKNIPERSKPTPAQKKAAKKNIKKAQAARRAKK